jgi:SAM-dependent methyltransferase
MPFDDNLFDLIVSNNGINNVASMESTLAECHRVGKDDAQFVVTMNLEETMKEFYSVFAAVLKEHGMNEAVEAMRRHIHTKRKPLDEVQKIMHQSGFRIDRIIHDSFKFRYADGTTMLDSGMIRFWFYPSWRSILPPDRADRLFEEMEFRLNALAESNGETVLSVPFVTIDCRCRKSR